MTASAPQDPPLQRKAWFKALRGSVKSDRELNQRLPVEAEPPDSSPSPAWVASPGSSSKGWRSLGRRRHLLGPQCPHL